MVFVTKRLILINWNINDAEELYKYASSSEIELPAGWLIYTDIEESKHIIEMLFDS